MAKRTESDLKQYQKDYYQEHRDTIRTRRHHRYTHDRAYRENALQRAKERYEQLQKDRPKRSRYEITDAKGQVFSTIGQLGTTINRNPSTIRKYHQRGILPLPTQYDTRGWRLYTEAAVASIKRAFEKFDAGVIPSLNALAEQLAKDWKKLGGKARAHKN